MGDDELRALGDELMRLSKRRSVTQPGSVLEASAFRLLWLLAEGPPRTQRELADELQLDQSTVNRQVNAALAHGLVERYAVEGSQSRPLRPTEAGRAAYERDLLLRAQDYAAAVDSLGPERTATLTELLGRLNDALDERLKRG